MSDISNSSFEVLKTICQSIYDKKGFNILSLDVRGISTITDYFVIAEGNVAKHLQALASEIIDNLKSYNKKPYRIEGKRDSDWLVLDFGDCIIHLFTTEARERYSLERVWSSAKVIDVPIQLTPPKSSSLPLRKGRGYDTMIS